MGSFLTIQKTNSGMKYILKLILGTLVALPVGSIILGSRCLWVNDSSDIKEFLNNYRSFVIRMLYKGLNIKLKPFKSL